MSASLNQTSTTNRSQSKRKKFANPNRGDIDEVFDDEWEETVLGPRKRLLQPVGVNFESLPQNAYEFVKIKTNDLKILSENIGKTYLPHSRDPFSIVLANSDPFRVSQFESCTLNDKLPRKVGHIFNVGGSIWAMDWCPNIQNQHDQYLAIGGYKSTTEEHHYIARRQKNDVNYAIQIWKIDCQDDPTSIEDPKLDIVICHEYGCTFDLQWCPYGAQDNCKDSFEGQSEHFIPKLGILAASFSDGSIGIFAIPKPDYVRHKFGLSQDSNKPLFVKFLKPLLVLSLPQVLCWTISWGGHKKIATGCTNGDIAIWDIEDILTSNITNKNLSDSEVVPIRYFRAHDSCIRQIAWNSMENPSHTLSCGHDGRLLIFNEREPWFKNMIQRIRAFMMTTCWPCHYGGIAFADTDNTVRYIRMDDLKKTTGIIMHHANRISASYFHPFMASCSADGTVKMANICRLRDRHQVDIILYSVFFIFQLEIIIFIHGLPYSISPSQKPIQVTLYRIGLDEDQKTILFWDNIKSQETTATYHTPQAFSHFFKPEVSIQRIAWNPNFNAGTWIASGGTLGLVRVESADRE
ncbi:WD40-repeat-containing domain protein [Gigaspora rosea]|uniref:WD40-repeat-containing domain protein n=1 Tax=Gigaspora rosea TaxID=44941 RepID=A0A397VUV0_9GLOM|nr:WD40-repeat-containing domain protein [Gigaspora rosea]